MLQTDRQTGALDRNNTTVPRDVAGARGEVRCWLFAIFSLRYHQLQLYDVTS